MYIHFSPTDLDTWDVICDGNHVAVVGQGSSPREALSTEVKAAIQEFLRDLRKHSPRIVSLPSKVTRAEH